MAERRHWAELILDVLRPRFLAKVRRNANTGCLEWIGAKKKKGYGYLSLQIPAHQLALLLAGRPLAFKETLHECDNRACVEETHLRRGTRAQNMGDCRRRGRYARQDGQHNGRAKLTPEKVVSIRQEYGRGRTTQKSLAQKHKVDQTTISRIVRAERWTSAAL